uniref:Uncharacterized protein n=1 Tax=Phytophthora fragariae TaxID=53985 RepID=A0A6A3DJC3_9STRA|nr:hypothetical protein PF009_g29902 [Phytophthora fragariae]
MATTDTCLPRLRVFLDASLLTALVLTGLALRRRVVSSGPPSKPDDLYYDHLNRTFRRSVAGSPATLKTGINRANRGWYVGDKLEKNVLKTAKISTMVI